MVLSFSLVQMVALEKAQLGYEPEDPAHTLPAGTGCP